MKLIRATVLSQENGALESAHLTQASVDESVQKRSVVQNRIEIAADLEDRVQVEYFPFQLPIGVGEEIDLLFKFGLEPYNILFDVGSPAARL
jgi:hypothetical protein